jgi:hypothetical protein
VTRVARQITKQLAQKIIKKLKGRKVKSKNAAHDEYEIEHEGEVIGHTSIRRSSNKEIGHDHVQRDLQISTRQAKDLANCPMSREDYIQHLRDIGEIDDGEDDVEENESEERAEE